MQRQTTHPRDARIQREQRFANLSRWVDYTIRKHRHAIGRPTPLTLQRFDHPSLLRHMGLTTLDAAMLTIVLAVVGTAALLIKH